MRYPAAATAERHERVLDVASRMFRERGFDGVSVADVMKAAGMTHGAFPAHFASKEALFRAGVERGLSEFSQLIDRAASSPDSRAAFVEQYLSERHRDNPDHGCVMAALAAEIAREDGGVREAFGASVALLVERMARRFFPRRRHSRARAISTLCTLVGAITLSRAVRDTPLSAEILAAARAQLSADHKDLASAGGSGLLERDAT